MSDKMPKDHELMKDVDIWLDNNRIATRRRVPGTGTIIHEAYEPVIEGKAMSHSTMILFGGVYYGTIVSARLYRGSMDFFNGLTTAEVENFQADLEACAYTALMEAFPYLRKIGRRHDGRMIVQLEPRI